MFVGQSNLFFSSKPLGCPPPFLLPIWVASSMRENEVVKSHCQLLLFEQLCLNKFLCELRGGASCLIHSITWSHTAGLYKFHTTVESTNVQRLTLSEVPFRHDSSLLLSPSVSSQPFYLVPGLLPSVRSLWPTDG